MGMSPAECVSEVGRLLQWYPGVRVIEAVHSATDCKTYITLSITSLQSFARLVEFCCARANVHLNVRSGARFLEFGQPFDESNLRYLLEFPDEGSSGSFSEPPAPIHIFGIAMANDLKLLGLIAAGDADNLLRAWRPS